MAITQKSFSSIVDDVIYTTMTDNYLSSISIANGVQSSTINSPTVTSDVVASIDSRLTSIEERLGILAINTELEAEWSQLRELGEKYRAMERDLLEKQTVWGMLSK